MREGFVNNANELITWTKKLACGIKMIDDQHKGLVCLINEMFDHVTGDYVQEHDYFNRVIQEVTMYIKNHFATEEKILLAVKFAGYPEHKMKHDSFVLAIVESICDYQAGKRVALSSFTKFLKDWVLSHIALDDKQYFEYFFKIATRKADGRLSINLNDVNAYLSN